jgi:hypothetical protein
MFTKAGGSNIAEMHRLAAQQLCNHTPDAREPPNQMGRGFSSVQFRPSRSAGGSHMPTVIPWPSPSLSAHMRPPCASAICRQMCRPRPIPGSPCCVAWRRVQIA